MPWPAVIGLALLACLLYGLAAGIRSDIGILLNPMASHANATYGQVSTCIAVMQLVFGASQPAFGKLASRRGNRSVILAGVALLFAGIATILATHSLTGLFLGLSVLFGLGAGAISFALVLTSATYLIGEDRSMTVSGMLNAAAGLCGFLLSPSLQQLLTRGGLAAAVHMLLVCTAALVPIALIVTSRDPVPRSIPRHDTSTSGSSASQASRSSKQSQTDQPLQSSQAAVPLKTAFRDRAFLLLVAGFSTCGFHMVIIESHLYSQYLVWGLDGGIASWAYSIYGLATIVGALLSGALSQRLRKSRLLGGYYAFRAIWVLLFVFALPKTAATSVLFAIGLGMTGDATVSPTSGIVGERFGLRSVAMLVGTLFLCHQCGAFLSAWLGGAIEQATGGYALLWLIDVALCTVAAAASLCIERTERR